MDGKARFLIVIGTRPEAIKMAPVISQLKADEALEVRLCVTGQHRDLLDPGLAAFGLVPDIDLNLMRPGRAPNDMVSIISNEVGAVLARRQPDRVIVHGDTTTTLGAASAAARHGLPVAHIEAGLRSGNPHTPWPEEMNRRATDAVSDLHFAPTNAAARNLRAEGMDAAGIFVTGNTGIDALLQIREKLGRSPALAKGYASRLSLPADRPLILVTGHRRENFGAGLDNICDALNMLADRTGAHILYPVHPNPNVRAQVSQNLGACPNIQLVDPLDYPEFVYLMNRSHIIVTDSGGIQEEAPALGKPVLVTRHNTERPEAVAAGAIRLVGTEPSDIAAAAHRLLADPVHYAGMARAPNPYGDGRAATRIAAALKREAGGAFRSASGGHPAGLRTSISRGGSARAKC